MKGKKNVKTLARDALKLQAKILKDVQDIRDCERAIDNQRGCYDALPAQVEEARADVIEAQKLVDAALEELSKPLHEYHYESRYYSRDHEGPRRYSSKAAQVAWDATQQAERKAEFLAMYEAEAARTLEEYVKPMCEGLDSAWQGWNEHNALFGATMARIRFILKRDVLDLSELATDKPKEPEDDPQVCKMHHVDIPDVRAHAAELYKAARAIRITKNQPLPVLAHILVRVTDDGLKLYTRTLEEDKARAQTVNCWANGTRWETCVPARTFTDWLGVMAKDDDLLKMTFDPTVQVLQIRTDYSRTEFKCLDAQEFPPC